MGKDKGKFGVPNKHLHARINFLKEAATYLTHQAWPKPGFEEGTPSGNDNAEAPAKALDSSGVQNHTAMVNSTQGLGNASHDAARDPTSTAAAARLTSHLTHIAKRSQIRLQPATKHQICKCCSNVLVEGKTSKKFIENLSKRTIKFPKGKKHADVLVVGCGVCGGRKRWPVGAKRQRKKGRRRSERIVIPEVERGSVDVAAEAVAD